MQLKLTSVEKGNVPLIEKSYHWSFDAYFSEFNYTQKRFYLKFKNKFFDGIYLDVCENGNYIFALIFEILESKIELNKKIRFLNVIEELYPISESFIHNKKQDILNEQGRHFDAWILVKNKIIKEKFSSSSTIFWIITYEQKLKHSLLDIEMFKRIGAESKLTKIGQKNIDDLDPYLTNFIDHIYSNNKKSFFEDYYLYESNFNPKGESVHSLETFEVDYYRVFFETDSEFELFKDMFNDFHNKSTVINGMIITEHFAKYMRKAENLFRENNGLPKIGEGWINETYLYKLIKDKYRALNILQHAKPVWLGNQHLDIWIRDYNIAIEYQGKQHDEPVDFFGGKEAFIKNKERDRRKRVLCKKNSCNLIEVRPGYDENDLFLKIDEIIRSSKSPINEDLLFVKLKKEYKKPVIKEVKSKAIYDCMTEQIVSKTEVETILGKKVNFNNLQYRDSIAKRFIYNEKKGSNKTYKNWKNILEIKTGKRLRFNQKYFAEYIGTSSNNVSAFFRGKAKSYKGYTMI
jgi:hypothetical protein